MGMMVRALLIAGALLMLGGRASAQSAVDGGASAAGPMAAVSWLAGHWVGEGLGGWNETLWSPPRAGSMMGVYRHIREGRVVFYEFLTLAVRDGALVKALKHFDPDMTGWEEPTESVRFPFLRVDGDAVIFDGMTYRRDGPDRMEVTVMLGPDPDHLEPEVFTFRRVRR